jgi:glycosyltransferase involved in cell wall biosynthesis
VAHVPAQQSPIPDHLRIEMVDGGEGEAGHRIDVLAAEFARSGHEVIVRGRGGLASPSSSTPDVVHAHGWPAVAAAGVPGSAVAVASIGEPGADLDPVALDFGRAYDRVIAPSSDTARRLLDLGLRRDRMGVVPDGVDAGFFTPGPDGPGLRPTERPYRILVVRPTLAPEPLLDAMTAIRRIPEARLFVAGGPPAPAIRRDPLAKQIAAAAQRIGVAKRIFLLGQVRPDRLPDLYRSADAVVCTGEPDAGRVALEAMACAVPVVAYAEGAVADILIHGVSGVLVERGNTYALAEALRGLLASEPRRYAYAVSGLSRVQERFTWPRVAEQIEAFYRTAIVDRRGRPAVIEMQDS